ncbi:hypothetical protein N0V83_008552 [Neocucurbitaria cava]|uniref:Uncharacterized protein n=1 Tax=Neocucurbitaria cava TaxID=798079 RepID=A0A9W9CIW6_9PLEO|nr:hypothetical protein N0V83_008552 [Neocucurbitaria cava]
MAHPTENAQPDDKQAKTDEYEQHWLEELDRVSYGLRELAAKAEEMRKYIIGRAFETQDWAKFIEEVRKRRDEKKADEKDATLNGKMAEMNLDE